MSTDAKLDLILNNMVDLQQSQEEMKKELKDLNEKTSILSDNQILMKDEISGLSEKTFMLSVGQHQIKEELHSLTNSTSTLREEFYLFRHEVNDRFNEINATLTRIEEDQTKDIEAILEEISAKLDERDQRDFEST
ncbi:hypothetical protein AB685_03790 [Bacillus sp. LL01]|uniref:hypothetical protein n=1 Tax=Bacillus sp. LL01 TaxID=1665556 RepID=UPI00064CFC44|nr:hypothetical protein [Bacillus sp. LL01]KMJ59976.1 hypothetical protein AB685_03790 [Bacillus sp. LL01]